MIIKTYKELEEYYKMFKEQKCDLLIIKSKGGLGKTSTMKKIMKDDEYVYINNHSTPLQTYKTLYGQRDVPVCFDDMDAILSNKIMVSLLKSLTDISMVKELHYNTTSKLIEDVPSEFKTSSNVCILLNEMDIQNKSLEPLLDRGFFIDFSPSKEEILKKIRSYTKSQSIDGSEKCVLTFFEDNYKKINDLSFRVYQKALQLYTFDSTSWKSKFMSMIGFDEKTINYIELKDKYETDKERIVEFKWSRATYFRVKMEYEER